MDPSPGFYPSLYTFHARREIRIQLFKKLRAIERELVISCFVKDFDGAAKIGAFLLKLESRLVHLSGGGLRPRTKKEDDLILKLI